MPHWLQAVGEDESRQCVSSMGMVWPYFVESIDPRSLAIYTPLKSSLRLQMGFRQRIYVLKEGREKNKGSNDYHGGRASAEQ